MKTVEKHKREAEAAGLKLIGPGRNASHKTYKWILCDHTSEYTPNNIRKQNVRCEICYTAKLEKESSCAGVELLGPGRNSSNKKYRWIKCGHIAEYRIEAVRVQNIRCQPCLDEKHKNEALVKGLELIGKSKILGKRIYRWLVCNHIAELDVSSVRRGYAICRACNPIKPKRALTSRDQQKENFNQKWKNEAIAAGLEFIEARGVGGGLYRCLSCGQVNERDRSSVRAKKIVCSYCFENKLQNEANAVGLEFIGQGKTAAYRKYKWNICGHESEYQIISVRKNEICCQECLKLKHQNEAISSGLELIGKSAIRGKKTYRWLQCGHVADYAAKSVRIGWVRCQICHSTSYSRPSNLYVLLLTAPDSTSWVKLGFSKNLKTRCDHYGLPGNTQIQNILTCPVPTGSNAIQIEKALHKKYRGSRLDPVIMKSYHRRSGATECYPLHLLHDLTQELRKI